MYAKFGILYQCEDLTLNERSKAVLRLKENCIYMVEERKFEALRNHGEELSSKQRRREQNPKNVVLFANSLVIGHKTVEHTIKYKLDN